MRKLSHKEYADTDTGADIIFIMENAKEIRHSMEEIYYADTPII